MRKKEKIALGCKERQDRPIIERFILAALLTHQIGYKFKCMATRDNFTCDAQVHLHTRPRAPERLVQRSHSTSSSSWVPNLWMNCASLFVPLAIYTSIFDTGIDCSHSVKRAPWRPWVNDMRESHSQRILKYMVYSIDRLENTRNIHFFCFYFTLSYRQLFDVVAVTGFRPALDSLAKFGHNRQISIKLVQNEHWAQERNVIF